MVTSKLTLRSSLPFALGALVVACSSAGVADLGPEHDPHGTSTAPIIGGTPATSYPEAALIDMYENGQMAAACSGAVIAPKVVLTAGHCIHGINGWKVTTPYAGKQSKMSNKAITTYKGTGGSVDPNSQDVGLIFLDDPIQLDIYPKIQGTKLPNGTKMINVGRIQSGQFSSTALFAGKPVSVDDGASYGYPFDYYSTEIIQSGDSGGPVFLPGQPHVIAAVNSGAGAGTQVLARTDAVAKWIADAIAAHGGDGNQGGGGSGGSGGAGGGAGSGGSAGSGDAGAAGTGNGGTGNGGAGNGGGGSGGSAGAGGGCQPTCAGAEEVEPNESVSAAGPLGAASCGTIGSAEDQDWYTWSANAAGVPYAIEAVGGDAQVLMWKLVDGQYFAIANTSPTKLVNTSNAPGKYFVAVWSPSGTTGAYKLTLTH